MDDAKSAALRLVLSKKRTEKEVFEALIKKGFSPDSAKEAAAYYRQNGYIDHADYARRFSHDAARIKGHGPERIRRDLSMRGIEEEFIDAALGELDFDLGSVMKARFGEGRRTEKELARIYGYFCRKGFAPAYVRSVMGALYSYD